MTSFDIEFVFAYIPLQDTFNICVEKLFKDKTKVINLIKESFDGCRNWLH